MSKKRGQGEGSIFKRQNGLWVAQLTIQGKHVNKYFKSQREGRAWLQATRQQLESGLTLAGVQTSLEQYLREWLEAHKLRVRPKTAVQYQQIIAQHILPALGKVKLKDVRPDQIQSLYAAKLRDGKSERTVLLIHCVLHRSLEQALKWGLIGRNPADAVTRPRFKRKEMKTLSDDQARSFLSFAKGSRLEALYWLAVSTGLRQGELLGLKWTDLDWRNRRLQIQRQVQRVPQGGLGFSEPKSAAGKRVIVLGKAILEKLRAHMEIQDSEKALAGSNWKEYDLIFPSTIGTPLDHRNLYRDFKEMLEQANLPSIRFHDLRHTAATLMLQQGIHPKVVQERLGHSDISLTLNTYSHVMPSMQEDAADKLDELLTPLEIGKELRNLREASALYVSPRYDQR